MRLIGLAVALTLSVLAPLVAEAQPAGKTPRIGVLASSTAAPNPFLQGLRDLGYVEGRNLVIERPSVMGSQVRYNELPRAAAELVRLKVDAVFAPSTETARVARTTIDAIPVVFVTFADPVRAGLVASLSHPGGNMTGLTMITGELAGKRLELLREVIPKVKRVAVLWNPGNRDTEAQVNETRTAGRALGIEVDVHRAAAAHELDTAFAAIVRTRASALLLIPDTMFNRERRRIAELATTNRLPVIYHWQAYVDAGGLMSYGPNLNDLHRRAAIFIDKILKGAKPADLPVEQPTKFELVINLKTAKALGLTIPPSVLGRADQVIE